MAHAVYLEPVRPKQEASKALEDKARARSVFNPGETELIAIKLRQCGMVCIQRSHGIDYQFGDDDRQTTGAVDDGGLPGVRVILRDEIISRINRNKKLSASQKKIERDILTRRLDREVRNEAKYCGFDSRLKEVR